MKILVISDTHLTGKFDKKKFEFLVKIISDADRVILNGDFWDYWYINFNEFVKTPWNQLFPLLKQKNTVYIYGNHDPKNKCDERTDLFATQSYETYKETIEDVRYIFTHGDKLLKNKEGLIMKLYGNFINKIDSQGFGKLFYRLLLVTEILAVKLFGLTFITNSKIARKNNSTLKTLQIRDGSEWLICSHTHGAHIDYTEKFANCGCITYGCATYLLIENAKINLVKATY